MNISAAAIEEFLADLRDRQNRSWPQGTSRSVTYELGEIPITEYLKKRAASRPDGIAYVFYGRQITFAEIDEASDRIAAYLIAHGVQPGDRVGVMLPNCPQFVILFYAILKAAAVHVPINPMFRPAELEYEIRDSGVRVLFALDELERTVTAVAERCALETTIFTTAAQYLPDTPTITVPDALRNAPNSPAAKSAWEQLLRTPIAGPFPTQDLDALAALNYTGGTTGLPKGCEHTQRHMLYTAATSKSCHLPGVDSSSPDGGSLLSFLPVFWIAGENTSVIAPIYSGVTCVLLYRWDPLAVMEAIQQYNVVTMGGTVDNYVELLDHPRFAEFDLTPLSYPAAMSFVTKLTPEIRHQWSSAVGKHSVLRESAYGMTETHTMDTFIAGFQADDRDLNSRPVFCGLPVPGTDIVIRSFGSGALLPIGEEGEIWVRSPSLLTRYWNDPDATAQAIENGWFHTGDIGQLDDDGFLHYLGRNKEMLKVNGMSVFPSELEVLLSGHPAIAAVAVIGVADADRGERPLAFVQIAEGDLLSADDIYSWCRSNMATYKVPLIELVNDMPMTATGKIRKNVLAERRATTKAGTL